ncbi:hypothetical protein WME97_06155 [Sorangium sp. So ce367]|uniref:hypothetical protein n=1 Tax=Sorangium sp. So ce367 TaxID=3133305 RepID=UPI003F62E3F6
MEEREPSLPATRYRSKKRARKQGRFRPPTVTELGLLDLELFLQSRPSSWPDSIDELMLLDALRLRTRYYRWRFVTDEQSALETSTDEVLRLVPSKRGPETTCSVTEKEKEVENDDAANKAQREFNDLGPPAAGDTLLLLAAIQTGDIQAVEEVIDGADLYLPCAYIPCMLADQGIWEFASAIDFYMSPRQAAFVEYACALLASADRQTVCAKLAVPKIKHARKEILDLLLAHDRTDAFPKPLLAHTLKFDLAHAGCLIDSPCWTHFGKDPMSQPSSNVRDFVLLLTGLLAGLCLELNEAHLHRSCGVEDLLDRLLAIDSVCELCIGVVYGQQALSNIGQTPLKAPTALSPAFVDELFRLQADAAGLAHALDAGLREDLGLPPPIPPGQREDLWGAAKRNLWVYLPQLAQHLRGSEKIWSVIFTPQDLSGHIGKLEALEPPKDPSLVETQELAKKIVSSCLLKRGAIDLATLLELRSKLPANPKVELIIMNVLGLGQSLQQTMEEALAAAHAARTHPKVFGAPADIKNKYDRTVCGANSAPPDVEYYGLDGLAWDAKRLGGNQFEWGDTQKKGFASTSNVPCALLLDATYANQRRYQRAWAAIFRDVARGKLRLYRMVKGERRPALLEISVDMICEARGAQVLSPSPVGFLHHPSCTFGAYVVDDWLKSGKLQGNAVNVATIIKSNPWVKATLDRLLSGQLVWYDFFSDHTRELPLGGGRHICLEVSLRSVPEIVNLCDENAALAEEVSSFWRIIWVVDQHRFFITFTHYERWCLGRGPTAQPLPMPAFFELEGPPPSALPAAPTGTTFANALGAFGAGLT